MAYTTTYICTECGSEFTEFYQESVCVDCGGRLRGTDGQLIEPRRDEANAPIADLGGSEIDLGREDRGQEAVAPPPPSKAKSVAHRGAGSEQRTKPAALPGRTNRVTVRRPPVRAPETSGRRVTTTATKVKHLSMIVVVFAWFLGTVGVLSAAVAVFAGVRLAQGAPPELETVLAASLVVMVICFVQAVFLALLGRYTQMRAEEHLEGVRHR